MREGETRVGTKIEERSNVLVIMHLERAAQVTSN